jgi:hypothetical protein
MMAALARPSIARLVRRPGAWIAAVAWGALACAIGALARARGAVHGADHVLVDTYGALVLPLLTYAIVRAAFGPGSLRAGAAPVVAFGAHPARAAAAAIAVAAVSCAAAGALIAGAVAFVAHGIGDPPPLRDAAASAYAGALGGLAYAAWFSLGTTFGRRGGGRAVLLVLDWVLGASGGAGALVTPRGHLRNLLGGAPPMDLSQRTSAAALLALTLLYALIAVRRAGSE